MSHEHRADAVVPDGTAATRVDKYISEVLKLFSRSQMAGRNASISVNDRHVKPSHSVRAGDRVTVLYDDPYVSSIKPEAVDLDVLYEDDQMIVIDKPSGVVVHPAAVGALLGDDK